MLLKAAVRLEVLYETALINGDVPLDAIDLIDQRRKTVDCKSEFSTAFSRLSITIDDWGWATRKTHVIDIRATLIQRGQLHCFQLVVYSFTFFILPQ